MLLIKFGLHLTVSLDRSFAYHCSYIYLLTRSTCCFLSQWDLAGLAFLFAAIQSRLTVVSREAKKKQPTRLYREVFTRSTALKFVNAVAKPPCKLSLSSFSPRTFLPCTINEATLVLIGPTIPKNQPLRVP